MRTPAQILIVDDNPENLDILQTRLAGHGYEILGAPRGTGRRPWLRLERTPT